MVTFSFSEIHEPYNANDQSRYIELTMVVDYGLFKKLERDHDKVHQFCKDIMKHVNAFSSPLNIFVALTGVKVWDDQNHADFTR